MSGGGGDGGGDSGGFSDSSNPGGSINYGNAYQPIPGAADSGGVNSGTDLGMPGSGPANQNTVGASVGASNTPMFQLGGSNFSTGGDLPALQTDPASNFSSTGGSSTSSIGNSAGVGAINAASPLSLGTSASGFAPPAGAAGGTPTDLTSLDALAATGNTSGTLPPTSLAPTQLTPEQLGQPKPAATAGGAAPAPAAAADKGILDSLGIKSGLGAAIGAGGLAYSVLSGQKQSQYAKDMSAQADALSGQGKQLLSYLQSGNLPPGLQASLTQATSAAKAKIISNFAGQGLNTDPSKNSALAAELAAVDQQALISTAQIGQQLFTSGIQETGLSSDLYKTLAGIDQTQTANIGKAIANFASSLSGGGGGITLKLPGQ